MYSPMTEGEAMVFYWTFLQDNGKPLDLTDAALTLVWNPLPGQSADLARFVGAGAFNVLAPPTAGKAAYTTTQADTLGKAGDWTMTPVATYPSGPRYGDPERIVVRPAP